MQLDPLDEEGNLTFPEDPGWLQKPTEPFDRLSFFDQGFGKKFDGKSKLPCGATQLVELESPQGFAYVAACSDSYQPPVLEQPVQLDEKQRLVTAPYYRYHYSERNHLVFDGIELADPKFKSFIPVALNSDLLILGDVKHFFTLYFNSDDIDAFITHKRSGLMGLMGGLQFYLRILYFRIQMSLMPEVNFFSDSMFMPMTLFLPVDAKKYLRRGSGIYYTWVGAKDTEWLFDKSQLEDLDLAILDPDFKGSSPMLADKYCSRSRCRYNLVGRNSGRLFSLHFEISRKVAELGFFPRLIRDVPAVEKVLKHPLSRYPASGRTGIYFETARMPEGEHTWNFWIQFPEEGKGPCNVQVRSRAWLPEQNTLEKK